MGTEPISFPPQITATKCLSLLGHGITDIEIHFLQIKFTEIGVYMEPEIVTHLQKWKGKSGIELVRDDDFFEALVVAPVEKLVKVMTIKEIKGSQYAVQLESDIRDRLVAIDKYEEKEEEALEKVVEFFQSKYFKKSSMITYFFPTKPSVAEIVFASDGLNDKKIQVSNTNVMEMIQKWYLQGSKAVSPSTIASLANNMSNLLSN